MIYLGLGSNLGNRLNYLKKAIRLIEAQKLLHNIRVSKVYESEALLPPERAPGSSNDDLDWARPYLNLVICGESTLQPSDLLSQIKRVEREIGRKERTRWAPREIDIDILDWKDVLVSETHLKIPHPELHSRPFVLRPLKDLSPSWRFPCSPYQEKTPEELLSLLPNTEKIEIFENQVFDSEIVGILNITPDSFSDGGKFTFATAAMTQARKLVSDGATVLDIGAESTRPGALSISEEEEWNRLKPILEALRSEWKVGKGPQISIDTRKPGIAEKALEYGADWINDVMGFTHPEMIRTVQPSNCDIVVMHCLSVPPQKDLTLDPYTHPIEQLLEWGKDQIHHLEQAGISKDRIIFDPGIGFGKTPKQSFQIIKEIKRLKSLGTRILVGHSRKSFLNLVTDKSFSERDIETLILSTLLIREHVDYIRVHEVLNTSQAVRISNILDSL